MHLHRFLQAFQAKKPYEGWISTQQKSDIDSDNAMCERKLLVGTIIFWVRPEFLAGSIIIPKNGREVFDQYGAF